MSVLRSLSRRTLNPAQVFGVGLDWLDRGTVSGEAVNVTTAMRLSTVYACVRLITNSIAGLPFKAYRDVGGAPVEITAPDWVNRPNPNPNITRIQHIGQVVTSLLIDGNAFVRFVPDVVSAEFAIVLDPRKVTIRGTDLDTRYILPDGTALTPAEMIHIPLVTLPGETRGLNPIELLREGIGLGIAMEKHGSAYFGNGAVLSGLIEFPVGVNPSPEDISNLKEQFRAKHVGTRKAHAVGALTGGATFKPMAVSNIDSQFLDGRKFTVEDIASRGFGIPPHKVGSQQPGAVSYASIEQRAIDYREAAVEPVANRVEVSYSRALPGPSTYFRFTLDKVVRADIKTRYESYATALGSKFLKVDEVRALEERAPFGEAAGGGFLETPNNNPPDTQGAP